MVILFGKSNLVRFWTKNSTWTTLRFEPQTSAIRIRLLMTWVTVRPAKFVRLILCVFKFMRLVRVCRVYLFLKEFMLMSPCIKLCLTFSVFVFFKMCYLNQYAS